jgi:hypothetical protein
MDSYCRVWYCGGNGSETFGFKDNNQAGGAVLLTYKKHPDLKYKFGLFYNREFFGNFFVPLAGIDWKINNRLQLFGVLPGNLVLERKVSRRFLLRRFLPRRHPHLTAMGFEKFLRIDDNQCRLLPTGI